MRLHPLILVVAGSFAAAAAIGVLFVMSGPGRGLPVDLVPSDSTAVIESGDFQTLAKVITALDATGNHRGWLISYPLAHRILSLRALLDDGALLIATVPTPSSREPGTLVLYRAKSAGKLERTLRGIRGWLGVGERLWLDGEYRGHAYEFSAPSVQPELVSMGVRRGDLILATSVELLRRAFDIGDQREPSFGSSGIFRALKRGSFGNHALRVVVPAWPSSYPSDSPPVAMTRAILGIRTLSGIAVSVHATERGFTESAEIVYRESRNGVAASMAALPPSPIDLAVVGRFLPADLDLHVLLSIPDLESMWERFPDLAAAAGMAEEETLRLRLKGLDQVLGVDLGREYLGALGSTVALGIEEVSPLPRGGLNRRGTTFSAVAALEVSRPAALKRILGRARGIARLFAGAPQKPGANPAFISWKIPGFEPLEPSYMVEEKYFAIATSPRLLVSPGDGGAKSLSTRGDIAEHRQNLPRQSHIVAFVHLGSFRESAFGTFLEPGPTGSQESLAFAATFHRHRVSVEASAPFPFILRTLGRIMAGENADPAHGSPPDADDNAAADTEVEPD